MGYRKLGRNTGHRRAMLRNLVTSLLEHDRITTTETRAKEVRSAAEKMITLGKRGDLNARRQALGYITTEAVVHRLFTDIAGRYETRAGGYTRMVKLGPRQGDSAPMVVLELV